MTKYQLWYVRSKHFTCFVGSFVWQTSKFKLSFSKTIIEIMKTKQLCWLIWMLYNYSHIWCCCPLCHCMNKIVLRIYFLKEKSLNLEYKTYLREMIALSIGRYSQKNVYFPRFSQSKWKHEKHFIDWIDQKMLNRWSLVVSYYLRRNFIEFARIYNSSPEAISFMNKWT